MTIAAPKVSVCIPVFNGANYIAESIESVLGQTFGDFELIVSDNSSTDTTADVVGSFRDPRLSYVRNSTNLGIARNANRCLQLARGEYVSFWHHDDIMLPENLKRKVRLLDAHPTVGFVHSDLILIDAQGHPLGHRWNDESLTDYIQPGLAVFRRYVAHMLAAGGLIFIGAVLTRRGCYDHLGAFRPELGECHDSEMWMRIALYYDVACLSTPLIKWRQHRASGTERSEALRGAGWLARHYAAVHRVFDTHSHRVPDCDAFRRQVRASFAAKALHQGWHAFHRHDFRLAAAHVALAVKIRRSVLTQRGFWGLALRVAAGPAGGRFFRALSSPFRRAP